MRYHLWIREGPWESSGKRKSTADIERCPKTPFFVGYVPGLPGAHSQGETIDELNANLAGVIEMLLDDCEHAMESEFVGTQTVQVGGTVAKRKLPVLKPTEVVARPVAMGLQEIRQKGSHK
jgi:predicted RNase H-like HicB family nuclease